MTAKSKKRATKAAAGIAGEQLVDIRVEIDNAIAGIRHDLRALPVSADPDHVKARASLVRLLGPLLAEKRKQEAAERRNTDRVTLEVVMAWVRARTPEQRAALVRDIQLLDAKRSGLA